MKLLVTIPISCDPSRSKSGREQRVRQWERKAHRSEGGGWTDRGWVAVIVPVAGDSAAPTTLFTGSLLLIAKAMKVWNPVCTPNHS
jgi:hypothetical protein